MATIGYKVVAPVLSAEYAPDDPDLGGVTIANGARRMRVKLHPVEPRRWRSPLFITESELPCLNAKTFEKCLLVTPKPWELCVEYFVNKSVRARHADPKYRYLFAYRTEEDARLFIAEKGVPTSGDAFFEDVIWSIFEGDLGGEMAEATDPLDSTRRIYVSETITLRSQLP